MICIQMIQESWKKRWIENKPSTSLLLGFDSGEYSVIDLDWPAPQVHGLWQSPENINIKCCITLTFRMHVFSSRRATLYSFTIFAIIILEDTWYQSLPKAKKEKLFTVTDLLYFWVLTLKFLQAKFKAWKYLETDLT